MWRMEAVSTENTKNEVKRRAFPLLKESHSFFVKTGPTFFSLEDTEGDVFVREWTRRRICA